MTVYDTASAGASSPRQPAAPPSARLHDIARRIRRLGTGGRRDATERFVIERQTVARECELLAREMQESGL